MRMTLQHYNFQLIGKSGKHIPVAYLPNVEAKLLKMSITTCLQVKFEVSMHFLINDEKNSLRKQEIIENYRK